MFFPEDPLSGQLFVFINRKCNYLKALYFDRSGYALWAKRLEQGQFHYAQSAGCKVALNVTDLKLILNAAQSVAIATQNITVAYAEIAALKVQVAQLNYEAYENYARQHPEMTHAQCWAHTRRYFEKAEAAESNAVAEALALIGELYAQEQTIRDKDLMGKDKLEHRSQHSEPVVVAFCRWCEVQCQRHDLLLSTSVSIRYARTLRQNHEHRH